MCEALIAVAATVIALYGWTYLQSTSNQPIMLAIHVSAAIAAGITLLYCLATYAFLKKNNYAYYGLLGYVLLIITITCLLITTGFLTSPFIALWMAAAAAAAAFGIAGIGLIIVISAAYAVYAHTTTGLSTATVIMIALMSLLPIVVGLLIWRHRASDLENEVNGDRSYNELANELSAISGQSEIVIAAITDGVIALNAKGEIQLINPAAQRLIGWGKSDALGLSYRSVMKLLDNHDQPINDTNDPVQRAMTTNKETAVDTFFMTTQDAKKKFLAGITVSPVGTMGSGVIIVFRDITSERAQEREQAEFISTASHEMRTPVASIEGYLGLALNPATATIDEKAHEYITKAQASASHLGRLFQDLLDVSKADDGRLNNTPEVIDVVSVIYDIIQGQLPKATERGLTVSYPPSPDLSPNGDQTMAGSRTLSPVYYIKVDSTHFREVLGNLIENAIKYTLKGGIEVDVAADNETVTVSVKDSGIGIPKEDIPHLFQKFYRVDNSDTREIGGTGLGLYLSRKLIEVMGGRIWVESTYKQGSTFFVRFPRMDVVEAHKEIEAATEKAAEAQSAQPSYSAADIPKPQPITPNPQPPLVTPIQHTTQAAPPPAPVVITPPISDISQPAIPRLKVPPRSYVTKDRENH